MNPALRPAGLDDAATLAALQAASFAEHWLPGAMRDLLAMPGAFALIAETGDGPRGFVLARIAADEAEIISIAVHPLCRRQGLGGTLLAGAAAQAQARGAQTLFLEVAVDNSPALGLYTGLGLAPAGRRKAYYPRVGAPPADALILRASLPLAGRQRTG